MISRNAEEYLETLYKLSRNGEPVGTGEISKCLKIAPASATEMVKKLAEEGYVRYSPRKGAKLTRKGLRIGENVTRKHRLLERFLYDVLKLKKGVIHRQACEMEHSLSDVAEESLCRFLKHPDHCPDDGKAIPPCNLKFRNCEECAMYRGELEHVGKRRMGLVPVSGLKNRDSGKVAFIRGDHKVLQRLLDMGLTPGTLITIEGVGSFSGPVKVAVRGSTIALGRDIASRIFVELSRHRPGGC